MTNVSHRLKGGFTLIELMIVIAIIGVLSGLITTSINNARAKGRDARRKHDLIQIRTALNLYYDKYNNWMRTGSGCGYNGNGDGWFNSFGGSYPKAMSQCLLDEGFTAEEIIDPTKGRWSSPASGYTYMKYTCGTPVSVYLFAKLETLPQSDTATDGTCCSTCDSSYGMNYYLKI
jgi:prepilin-type N-terminal cleavage/methylation domain-containing protein